MTAAAPSSVNGDAGSAAGAGPAADATRAEAEQRLGLHGTFGELRLFIEELCCEIIRLQYVRDGGVDPERILIDREVSLGPPGAFADIHVCFPGSFSYLIEIKPGYPERDLVQRIGRKYQKARGLAVQADKLVIMLRRADYGDWAAVEKRLRAAVDPELPVEIWDETRLRIQIGELFLLKREELTANDLPALQEAILRSRWQSAFGEAPFDPYLAGTLLWHLSSGALERLHRINGLAAPDILKPGLYPNVVVLMADLCSFSSYVRDTRDSELVRRSLTAFYSQARHAIHEAHGMLYQFVGDEVTGIFGFPERRDDFAGDALRCAMRLIDIGNSVSEHWQRQIDRVQMQGGLHIGIAFGDLDLIPLRAFSRTHIGFIGDTINIGARLKSNSGQNEIVVSNSFYQQLDDTMQQGFHSLSPIQAKNIGLIRCWKRRVTGEPDA